MSATLDVPAVLPNAAAPGLGGSPRVREVLARAGAGGRLSREDGLVLFREATLLEAGGAADAVRRRLHPPGRVTYQVDRNINYTNVCIYRCAFCAFYRPAGDAEGFARQEERILLYRELARNGLKAPLENTFPVLQALLGPEAWEEAVAGFLARYDG